MSNVDTRIRSWTKSIVWRIIGILLLGGITQLVTRDWREMTLITAAFHAIRVVLYYVHERVWEHVGWGRVKHPLAHLPVREGLTPQDLDIIAQRLRELGYLE